MATKTPDTSIGQLVAEYPHYARLFDRLGIDYCCGGDRSLAEACNEEGLDSETVLRMLDAGIEVSDSTSSASRDWTTAPVEDLIEHIETTHHAYLRRTLPRLEGLLEKVVAAHGAEAPWIESVKEVFDALKPDLEDHMEKEETIVFPFIRDCTTERSTPEPERLDGDPIALMEEEHDEAGDALKRMRMLSNDFTVPDWGCPTFRTTLDELRNLEADMHQHVHKENNILFPRARSLT